MTAPAAGVAFQKRLISFSKRSSDGPFMARMWT
jgi:hypothetical protein